MSTLRELQADVRAALLGGSGGPAAAAVLDDGLAAEARLAIYRHHVFATLTDVLKATYPVVSRLVHERFFASAILLVLVTRGAGAVSLDSLLGHWVDRRHQESAGRPDPVSRRPDARLTRRGDAG